MTSHRGSWIGLTIVATVVLLGPTAPEARAQPGFGPDPFWPYNTQYIPYTRNVGPASPEGGQGMSFGPGSAFVGANQFQNYLDSLQGPGRDLSDRSNIGMPYYRSAVSPEWQTRGRGPRQYHPNARTTERFEQSQRRVANSYLQYYSERDPARRAELLREYRQARHESAAAIADRGLPRRRTSGAFERRGATPTQNLRSGDATAADGPVPAVPAYGSRRSSAPGRVRPGDALDRSRAMDRELGTRPGSSAPASSYRPRTSSAGRPATTPPSPDVNRP